MRDLKTIFRKQIQLKWDQCLLKLKMLDIKYAWIKPLKDEKCKTVLNNSIKLVIESNCKLNSLWVDQGR